LSAWVVIKSVESLTYQGMDSLDCVSGTKTEAADPSSAVGCEVDPQLGNLEARATS